MKSVLVYRAQRAVFLPAKGSVTWPADRQPFAGLRSVEFRTATAVLRGWHAPSRNGATVLLVHGAGATRTQMLPEARVLAGAGYGVLIFDWPGSGESDGVCEWGESERAALRSAIDFAAQRSSDSERLAAVGFSMGGAILAQVAATDARLRAVVLTGTYARSTEQMRAAFGRWAPLLEWPARWDWSWTGMRATDPQPADVVASISPRPILIVTSSHDGTVPSWMSQRLFEAAREPREFLMIQGASHGDYIEVEPVVYPVRLLRFLNQALATPPSVADGVPTYR